LASSSEKSEGGLRTIGFDKISSKDNPLVTVITVVFNGSQTLEHTILSVIEQSYSNFEYIIVDGGSTDSTLDILRNHEGNIDYWISAKDGGIYDAINKGISLARGDYIGMLNADDYFADPSALNKIMNRFRTSQVDAVFSYLDIIDPNNLGKVLRKYRISSFSKNMLRIGLMPPHPTFYCKKSCYEKGGGYRTDYRIAADFEMLTRLLLKQNISWSVLKQITVKMRSGGLSSRGMKSNWIVNREIIRGCTENGLYTNMFLLALKVPIRLMERIL